MFKDGGNEEKKKNPTSSPVKCYFVRVASDAAIDKGVYYRLSHMTMYEARCLFMHAHTLASIDNYMARYVKNYMEGNNDRHFKLLYRNIFPL